MLVGLYCAVLLLALLCVVNLALVLRLGKVFRERVDPAGPAVPPTSFAVGDAMPAFTATTAAGEVVGDGDLGTGAVLIAFVSTTCAPCHRSLPELRRTVSELAARGARTLAVVTSPPHVDEARMVSGLPAEADVVSYTDYHTPVHEAFRISAYPTFLLFEDGRAVSVGADVHAIRPPVAA